MPDHQLRFRARQHLPEGNPVRRFEFVQRRIEIGAEMMGIGSYASEPRKMLDRRADA
jgi:hypothetical protein